MDMTGERRIPASREKVWSALNDPEILRAAIPGCKTLERVDDTAFKATASVRVGPVSASFTGDVRLLDLDPPNGYRIEGAGQGGAAGFAKGGASVKLAEEDAQTILSYTVKAEIGGKLAQLGTRLIDATAKQMADQFFDRFTAALTPPVSAPAAEGEDAAVPSAPASPAPPSPAPPSGLMVFGFPPVFWVGSAIFLFIFIMMFAGYL
jgi:carbon monoxide dehydrogenase subunit G